MPTGDLEILVLAAGSSSRLGRAKQLLPYRGHALIASVVSQCLETRLKVQVVLGARAEVIEPEVPAGARVTHCVQWEAGPGASLKAGLAQVHKSASGVLVVLGDQPLVTAVDLLNLVARFEGDRQRIVAARYGHSSLGPPVLFGAAHFARLAALPDHRGAKALLKGPYNIVDEPMPHAEVDIDTEEDWHRLSSQSETNQCKSPL